MHVARSDPVIPKKAGMEQIRKRKSGSRFLGFGCLDYTSTCPAAEHACGIND